MTYEAIELRREGAVAVLALNRVEKFNAVSIQMQRELQSALKDLSRDRDVRAVVLTGNGKAFCAGQDLTEFNQQGDDFRIDEHIRTTFNKVVLAMRDMDKPVIAAVNGVAAGAGASLALAADLRVCSENASFLQAFIRVGLVPDTGSTWFLPHMVGLPRALELAWTGRPVSAAEALQMGMVNKVVAEQDLLAETLALAAQLAAQPTRAIAMTKRAMYRALAVSLPDALEYEAQLQQAAAQTADHHEGVAAFLEKREPAFSGS